MDLLLRRRSYEGIAERMLSRNETAHAPHLLDAEVLHVLRRFERAALLPPTRVDEALDDLRDLRLVRHGHEPLLERAWALRHNLTAYDGLYVALAEALDAPLITTDARLASAPGHDVRVYLCE